MDSDQSLGRLIRTLKNEKCSNCGNVMQLRGRKQTRLERGVEINHDEEYKRCSVCGDEIEIRHRDKKKRLDYVDKTAFVPEKKEEQRNGYRQRTRPSESVSNNPRRSFRNNK